MTGRLEFRVKDLVAYLNLAQAHELKEVGRINVSIVDCSDFTFFNPVRLGSRQDEDGAFCRCCAKNS